MYAQLLVNILPLLCLFVTPKIRIHFNQAMRLQKTRRHNHCCKFLQGHRWEPYQWNDVIQDFIKSVFCPKQQLILSPSVKLGSD